MDGYWKMAESNSIAGIKIYITWDIASLKKWLSAVRHVEAGVKLQAQWMPYYNALDYYQLVARNLISQKYASLYVGYAPRYAAWKDMMGLTNGFWRVRDDLLKSLTVHSVGRGVWITKYFSGVPKGIKDSGGKSWFTTPSVRKGKRKEIAWYGKIMEWGGVYVDKRGKPQEHPPRPLFTPTLAEYKRGGYWNRYLMAQAAIRARWR